MCHLIRGMIGRRGGVGERRGGEKGRREEEGKGEERNIYGTFTRNVISHPVDMEYLCFENSLKISVDSTIFIIS